MSDFAKNLRSLRKEMGFSQMDLAKVLGYGYTAIANYEAGRTEPSFRDLLLLAEFLGVTTDELLGAKEISVDWQMANLFSRLTLEQQNAIRQAVSDFLR